jgi:ATP-binding cassette subfamily B protein
MTNDLVERMVGHRTRLAQEAPAAWHTEEDRDLERYQQLSEALDQTALVLNSLPRAWMVGGLAAIAIHIASLPVSPTLLAASLGGVLLAFQALGSIVGGVQTWVSGAQAWAQVAPVFEAATRREPTASVMLPSHAVTRATSKQTPLLLAKDLSYRYRALGRATLDRCGLQVFLGDRVLLQGPSGSGKSTLAAVLSGLRSADSGLLLLWGYDQPSVGAAAWRKRVAVAPQFHENHVFSETFAFNLLMGRRWPPTNDDLEQAEYFCNQLGLGDLLARMPSGLQQMLGESGWQLSHGERSRLFIARALLQNADIMILDESFAALDPKTLALALRCVLEYAPTLLVIAHP